VIFAHFYRQLHSFMNAMRDIDMANPSVRPSVSPSVRIVSKRPNASSNFFILRFFHHFSFVKITYKNYAIFGQ